MKATAPAKIILFGEHAVVYNQPAIAIPVNDVKAFATIETDANLDDPVVRADDFGIEHSLNKKSVPGKIEHIMKALNLVRENSNSGFPDKGWRLSVSSKIPVARGMGSSAAISVVLIKIFFKYLKLDLSPSRLIDLSYELEKFHHGTPSGIDNAVISLGAPILFQKEKGFKVFHPKTFHFVIGDTGIGKKTATVVKDVAARYRKAMASYKAIFEAIGSVANQGLDALSLGQHKKLGRLMNLNQSLLDELGVSSPELEHLIHTALENGALGAKLCGAGKGGCMVALADSIEHAEKISVKLSEAGAKQTFVTTLKRGNGK
ncbi:mevalonate kinase [candidate division KSB1 bacterium]|nr:mevalonate kinase [candidate division KSB1 bacterium]